MKEIIELKSEVKQNLNYLVRRRNNLILAMDPEDVFFDEDFTMKNEYVSKVIYSFLHQNDTEIRSLLEVSDTELNYGLLNEMNNKVILFKESL